MKQLTKVMIFTGCLITLAMSAWAAADAFGKPDTVFAELARVDDENWSVTLSFTNDENVVGLVIPFLYESGEDKLVADSVVFTDTRMVEAEFSEIGYRVDTTAQSVWLYFIGNIKATEHVLGPGTGEVGTVYISSIEDEPIGKLTIDSTTVHPSNSLLVVIDGLQGTPPDTVRVDRFNRQIFPDWVVTYKED